MLQARILQIIVELVENIFSSTAYSFFVGKYLINWMKSVLINYSFDYHSSPVQTCIGSPL